MWILCFYYVQVPWGTLIYLYIYISIDRKREREREENLNVDFVFLLCSSPMGDINLPICVYIY